MDQKEAKLSWVDRLSTIQREVICEQMGTLIEQEVEIARSYPYLYNPPSDSRLNNPWVNPEAWGRHLNFLKDPTIEKKVRIWLPDKPRSWLGFKIRSSSLKKGDWICDAVWINGQDLPLKIEKSNGSFRILNNPLADSIRLRIFSADCKIASQVAEVQEAIAKTASLHSIKEAAMIDKFMADPEYYLDSFLQPGMVCVPERLMTLDEVRLFISIATDQLAASKGFGFAYCFPLHHGIEVSQIIKAKDFASEQINPQGIAVKTQAVNRDGTIIRRPYYSIPTSVISDGEIIGATMWRFPQADDSSNGGDQWHNSYFYHGNQNLFWLRQ